MRDDIRKELLPKLKSDFQWKTERGEWLRGGKCPDCGEKQVYTNADAPWVLKCNRQERCGYEETVRDRYPDLFDTWSNRFTKRVKIPPPPPPT